MFCAYAVSFIGIISIYQKTHKINFVENTGLQSSYLIFAISFLAEIGLKLHKKKNIIVKMLYGIFYIVFYCDFNLFCFFKWRDYIELLLESNFDFLYIIFNNFIN